MLKSVAVLLLALAPLRAEAFTYTWVPKTEQGAEALRQGLERRAPSGGATVRQTGEGNTAGVTQSGSGNHALVVQRGSGNSASLGQTGSGNAGAVIQIGSGNSAEMEQSGGEAGVTIQVNRPARKSPPAPSRPAEGERAEATPQP